MESSENHLSRIPALCTEPVFTQQYREYLERAGILDSRYRAQKLHDGMVALPVLEEKLYLSVQENLLENIAPGSSCKKTWIINPVLSKKSQVHSPAQKLRMELYNLLESHGVNWTQNLECDLPRSWQQHGDLVIFSENCFCNPTWKQLGDELWFIVACSLGVKRLAKQGRVLNDGMRSPSVTLLLGDNSWVEHVDNGIRYTFDFTKCMFSAGNIVEKQRVANFRCSEEIIVDLYAEQVPELHCLKALPAKRELIDLCLDSKRTCLWDSDETLAHSQIGQCRTQTSEVQLFMECVQRDVKVLIYPKAKTNLTDGIGYFTLPFLVHAGAAYVYACEWNPHSVAALRRNLQLNKVSHKCQIHEGDNRQLLLHDVADRVNLGLIPTSEEGYQIACRVLKKNTGGMLHIHHNVNCFPSKHKEDDKSITAQDPGSLRKLTWRKWAESAETKIQNFLQKVHDTPWHTSIVHIEKVKSYAPHVDHIVLDLDCRPIL